VAKFPYRPALQAAVITSEDRRSYRHGGVDSSAPLASVVRWFGGRPLRGASTISMQLVTLSHPELRQRGMPRTMAQKWRQIRLAWGLERHWSKAEILEADLNRASYRGALQGIAAAATGLFGKAPHGITEAEAAVLAVLLRGPDVGGLATFPAPGISMASRLGGRPAPHSNCRAAAVGACPRPASPLLGGSRATGV
jgi:penicillin-binding protein 1C